MKKKFYSDYQRLDMVKKFKVSRKTLSEFALTVGIPRGTLRDWINAYNNIDGSFVRLNRIQSSDQPGLVLSNEDAIVKLIDTDTILKKSNKFSRFDHSIVVIEFEKIKITTSLEQALSILGKYYDRSK